jgi:hypothetical protein
MTAVLQTVMSVGTDTGRYRRPIRHRMANALVLLAFATYARNPCGASAAEKM